MCVSLSLPVSTLRRLLRQKTAAQTHSQEMDLCFISLQILSVFRSRGTVDMLERRRVTSARMFSHFFSDGLLPVLLDVTLPSCKGVRTFSLFALELLESALHQVHNRECATHLLTAFMMGMTMKNIQKKKILCVQSIPGYHRIRSRPTQDK